jgi:anti-anti-sigma factor
LLDALDAAAAIFDAEGALRCSNQRWTALFDEPAPPASLASVDGLAASSQGVAEGIQAILRGERDQLDVELPGAGEGAPRLALSATPCAVDGRRGALVRIRDQRPPRAEAAQRSIESFFDTILDHLPLLIFIKEAREFRFVRVNRHYEELYKRSRKDLLGKSNFDTLPRKDAEYLYSKDRAVIERGEPLDVPEELLNIPAKGPSVFHTIKIPLYDEDGAPCYIVGVAEDITAKKRAEEAIQRERAWIETQNQLLAVIREMSTPVIPVHEGVLVVPIIGHLDEARSRQMQDVLLQGIQRHRAETVLIDITGVPVLDAEVAGHLLEATRAAELLGAACVLVGASPEVARTMVTLGIDLGRISTQRDLQAGIRLALARQGKAITRSAPRANLR